MPFYILSFMLLLFCACKSECDTPELIPLNSIGGFVPPYSGVDTFKYLRNNIDTTVFIGKGISYRKIFEAAKDDTQCPKNYEEATYSFKNNNGDEIRVVYSPYRNLPYQNHYFKYYFNGIYVGDKELGNLFDNVVVNGKVYNDITYYTANSDTLQYFMICTTLNVKSPIIKIKYPGDTLTLLK